MYHHYLTWECLGMYEDATLHETNADALRTQYAVFLRDAIRFGAALVRVLQEWPIACEQFLSNDSINRIAWLGQASMYLDSGVPRKYRAGFMLLTELERRRANAQAAETLKHWERTHAQTNQGVSHAVESQGIFQWNTR